METLESCAHKMVEKHCECGSVRNRILLEMISLCPECQTLFTTVIYEIPQDRMHQVLETLSTVMAEQGIQSQGLRVPTNLEPKEDAGTTSGE